jgi:hypothetical protein
MRASWPKEITMDAHRKVAPRRRRSLTLKLWLLSAGLLAMAGLLEVEAGSPGARHEAAAAPAHDSAAQQAFGARLDDESVLYVPEAYRAIRAAGVEGAAPPIPPSETRPAQ